MFTNIPDLNERYRRRGRIPAQPPRPQPPPPRWGDGKWWKWIIGLGLIILSCYLIISMQNNISSSSSGNVQNTKIPTTQPTVRPTNSTLDETGIQEIIQSLVYRWYDIKTKADREVSNTNLNSVLRGDFLEYQLGVIETLRNKNCYWIFSNRRIRFDTFRLHNNSYATIELTVWEDADLYCNGQHDPASWTRYEPYTMRYVAERINATWYLTEKEVTSK